MVLLGNITAASKVLEPAGPMYQVVLISNEA